VTGCFDIMHFGHVIFLNYTKKQGDILIIGLGSDKTLRKLKGPERPILNEKLRSQFVGTCLLALKNGLVYENIKEIPKN